jgi:hypothetical protein
MLRTLRYALRPLGRRPGFTPAAVLTVTTLLRRCQQVAKPPGVGPFLS